MPFDVNTRELDGDDMCKFIAGDEVWVKPSPPSCTRQWTPGEVTKIVSKHTVDINGVPRHVRNVRKRCHGRTADVDHRVPRAVETDQSVQGDEGPGMLEMLDGLVENLPVEDGRADGMPQQYDGDVVIEERRPDVGARLPIEGAQGSAVNADHPVVVAEQPAVWKSQRTRRPLHYLDLYVRSDK